MSNPRWFPTLTGLKVEEDRSLPYRLVDAIFQLYRRHYDLQDKVEGSGAAPAAVVTVSPDGTVTIVGPHDERNLFPAADYAIGSRYAENDRDVEYVVEDVDAAHAWVWIDGEMRGVVAATPMPTSASSSRSCSRS